jgi:hypothetical protein
MPYRLAFLLLVLFFSSRTIYAQENAERVPQPQASSSASACTHIPDADTDSEEYQTGFHNGYKAGCKYGLSAQHISSGAGVDEYVRDTPAPISFQKENENLLKALGELCKGADTKARNTGSNHTDVWNLKYRVALLTQLIENPPKDCQ